MAKANTQTHLEKIGESYLVEMTSEVERFLISDLLDDSFNIRICNLEMGEEYYLTTGLTYSREVLQVRQSENVNWSIHGRMILLKPEKSCIEFVFYAKRESLQQLPFLSISRKQQRDKTQNSAARANGIRVVQDNNAEELITDVLVGSKCFDISNVQGIGPNLGMGRFYNGSSSIGIEEGIVFSTGHVNNIVGPNSSHRTGSIMGGHGGDPDLALLVNGQPVNDVVGIQFDFVPTSDTVRFRYVFASEEYCEWVNHNYNDVFGFFISGPGLSGPFTDNAINIATIPGTEDFVAIANVNHYTNQHLFFDNTPQGQDQGSGSATACGNLLFQDGVAVELIEFDGFTAIFEATAVVVPCETYTIKMVIGDVIDYDYDSGVFLEANSFKAGASAQMESRVSGFEDNLIFDECLNDMGYFVIKRLGTSDLNDSFEVKLSYSDMSTAVPGVDFEALPESILIPAGVDSVLVPLRILETYSGQRLSIIYELEDLCSCTSPFAEIIIDFNPNQPKAEVDREGILTCENLSVELSGSILTPELVTHYKWLDAGGEVIVDGELNLTVLNAGEYAFVVYNENSSCADTIRVSVEVDREAPEIGVETPDVLNCFREIVSLNSFVSSVGDSVNYSWEAPGGGLIVSGGETPSALVAAEGVYELTVRNEWNGCESTLSVNVISDYETAVVELTYPEELNCERRKTTIRAITNYSNDELQFNWHSADGSIVTNPTREYIEVSAAGNYEVEITLNRNGCSLLMSTDVSEDIEVPFISLGGDRVLPCSNPSILLEAETPNRGPEYELFWSSSVELVAQSNPHELMVKEEGIYTVRILNLNNGCWSEDQMMVSRNLPTALDLDIVQPICTDDPGFLSVLSVEGGTYPYTYRLNGGRLNNLESNGFFNNLQVANYQIEVIDALGCSILEEFKINEPLPLEVNLPERDVAQLGRLYGMPLELNVSDSDIEYVLWTAENHIDCPNCLRPSVEVLNPGLFELYLEDYRGCFARAEIYLDLDKRPSVFIPNAFSPNDDGVNEVFTIYSDRSVKRVLELSVYNRWGKRYYHRLDFSPNDEQIGWNGTDYRGQKAEAGVYVYIAVVELINGDLIELSGEVQLFR